METLRSIPIHQSLLRPELVLGGEREPVMLSALLSFITGIVSAVNFVWLGALCAVLFWAVSVWMFRRMAKADPVMTQVWRRHVGYRHHYPARASAWANGGYKC